MEKWKFPEISKIEDQRFDKSLKSFYDSGIERVVRENIQNSLDAKLISPVKVKITLGKINNKDLPEINEVLERIKCLKGGNQYATEEINSMKKVLTEEIVSYISFEDENTKGLKYSNDHTDTYKAYAFKIGVHNEDSDKEHEKIRGGSHGVGKIASNAASYINTIYFANCDKDGNQHIGGIVKLIDHEYLGNLYRATGYFTDNINKEIPFENNYLGIFKKETSGLKVIIPYLIEEFANENKIIKSICSNFFVAIHKGELSVEVNEKVIDSKTLNLYIENEEYFTQSLSNKEFEITPLYFKTYISEESKIIDVKDKKGNTYSFNIYFKYDEVINKGRVAIIRNIGMKIEDRKLLNYAKKPFNAIAIPSNLDCDAFLKSLENESHTALSHEHFKDKILKDNAKRFLNEFDNAIKRIIDEYSNKNNTVNGEIETKDIIYEIENSFKKRFNECNVVIDTGLSRIVKRKPEKRRDRVGETEKIPPVLSERSGRKPKNINENGEREKEYTYNVSPYYVKRGIMRDKEIIEIDLSQNSKIKDNQEANLVIKILDGMGKEYEDEFKIEENYSEVVDLLNLENPIKKISDNRVENVVIKNKKIKLNCGLGKKFNKSAKFVYYLEV